MSYYVTNENSVLNINNAHLKVSGNIQTDVMKLGAIEFAPATYPPESDVPGTVNFTNVTTGVTTSSNLNVGGTLMLGTVEVVATTHTLENTTALGNVTSNTIQFTNTTTSLVASGNVEVGGVLTATGNVEVSGNVVAGYLYGDGSNISGISSTLQAITDSGPGANVTSNTVQFSNAITSLTATSNIEVAGFVGTSGTGGLIIPGGTNTEQPTGATGMIRYNSTLDKYEGRVSTIWMPMTGDPPLYTFSSFKFTNAGKTGRDGPSLNDIRGHADYDTNANSHGYPPPSWDMTDSSLLNLGNEYNGGLARNGFQLWTVPETGTYRIQAQGAMGGDATVSPAASPGKGAQVQADFALTQGTKINILVGQGGLATTITTGYPHPSPGASNGGGGASWVLKQNFTTSSDDIYLIAGGGTGTSEYDNQSGTGASGNGSTQGTNSAGGAQSPNASGGGAGWGGDGNPTTGQNHNTRGRSPHVGAQGGALTQPTLGEGGFGGGGAGQDHSPGGGGGYGGGGGAYYNNIANYGQSSSYIMTTATNRTFSGNPHNGGAGGPGWVIITKIS